VIVHFVDIGGIYDHRDVGQGMKQTLLYLWYPLFQAVFQQTVGIPMGNNCAPFSPTFVLLFL
jgi:hypothetical protein